MNQQGRWSERQDLNLPHPIDFAQGDSDDTPGKGAIHPAKPACDSDRQAARSRHPLELARISRKAILRVGDFEPLPAIGQRRRRHPAGYTGPRKLALFLALIFLLAACRHAEPDRHFLRGTIDANGNPWVPR